MRIWSEIKRRRQEQVNSYSLTTATLTANMVAFLRSFGDKTDTELPTARDYLPYRFVDTTSPKYQLQQKMSSDTVKLIIKLKRERKIPAKVMKNLNAIPGMVELFSEAE